MKNGKLVLNFIEGRTCKIGDDIEICLESVKGKQCRISIIAPKNIAIKRDNLKIEVDINDTQKEDN